MSLSVLMYEVSVQRLPVFLPSTFFDSINRALYKGLFCPSLFFSLSHIQSIIVQSYICPNFIVFLFKNNIEKMAPIQKFYH